MSRPGHDTVFDPPPDDTGGSPTAPGEPVTLPRDAGAGLGTCKRSASPLEAPMRAAVPSAVAARKDAPRETKVLHAHGPNGVSMSASWVPGPRFDSGGAVSEALSWMDEKMDRARGQAVQSADAAITRFANQYLEEHQSDLGCPPDLLRAIRSWESVAAAILALISGTRSSGTSCRWLTSPSFLFGHMVILRLS